MGMSEVTAVAVVYKELQLARKAIFPDLQEKARPQLDCLVDEPEFVELFQVVSECGGAGTLTLKSCYHGPRAMCNPSFANFGLQRSRRSTK